jgi:hypothetical protein
MPETISRTPAAPPDPARDCRLIVAALRGQADRAILTSRSRRLAGPDIGGARASWREYAASLRALADRIDLGGLAAVLPDDKPERLEDLGLIRPTWEGAL